MMPPLVFCRQANLDRSVLGRVLKHDGVHEPWTPVCPRSRHTQEPETSTRLYLRRWGHANRGDSLRNTQNTGTPGMDMGVARVSVTQ